MRCHRRRRRRRRRRRPPPPPPRPPLSPARHVPEKDASATPNEYPQSPRHRHRPQHRQSPISESDHELQDSPEPVQRPQYRYESLPQ